VFKPKTTKPTRPQTGLKKRRGPLPSDSATRHTSQKPPLEREVGDLLARRLRGASRLPILTGILAGLIGLALGTATFGQIGTFLVSPAVASPADDAYLHTIDHLLRYVEKSGCVFIRNDKEYNSEEAAKHLQLKYDFFRYEIKTPEEFIELAASKSSVSGRPYWVRCADHPPTPSADWLRRLSGDAICPVGGPSA